ncbi:MAG: hypothetical protein ACP5DX_13955 [Paracoccaceae bacterium]
MAAALVAAGKETEDIFDAFEARGSYMEPTNSRAHDPSISFFPGR